MAQLFLWKKTPPNSGSFWVLRLFNICARIFYAPNAIILLVYIPDKIKMSFSCTDDFFVKIAIFCKTIAGPLSEVKRHWMVNWLKLLNQLDVIPKPLYKIRLNNVTEMFSCWERRWVDFDVASRPVSATAAIFSDVCTVFVFGLSVRMPISFTFSQHNEHTELTVLLFFQNRNLRTHSAALPRFSK